jgi:phage FluMu protein Com
MLPGIGRLTIFVKCIVGYIEVKGASCPKSREVNYFYKVYCVVY